MPVALAMLLLALLAVPLAVAPSSSGLPAPEPSRHAVALEAGVDLTVVPVVAALSARPWVDDRPFKARIGGLLAVLVLVIFAAPGLPFSRASLLADRASRLRRRSSILLRAPPPRRFA